MRNLTLYDVGYADFKDPNLLFEAVKQSHGHLVDIRYVPRSRIPAWNSSRLVNALPLSYIWVKDLGNVNYKGGPIQIQDIDSGLLTVVSLLNSGPVFIMCACWNRAECHRMHVTNIIYARHGIRSVPLTATMARAMIASDTIASKPEQAHLF